MDIKALRKGMREIKKQIYPYRSEYNYGFHDAVEMCSKLIEQQIRKDRKESIAYMKGEEAKNKEDKYGQKKYGQKKYLASLLEPIHICD